MADHEEGELEFNSATKPQDAQGNRALRGIAIPLWVAKSVETCLRDIDVHEVLLKENMIFSSKVNRPIHCHGRLVEHGWESMDSGPRAEQLLEVCALHQLDAAPWLWQAIRTRSWNSSIWEGHRELGWFVPAAANCFPPLAIFPHPHPPYPVPLPVLRNHFQRYPPRTAIPHSAQQTSTPHNSQASSRRTNTATIHLSTATATHTFHRGRSHRLLYGASISRCVYSSACSPHAASLSRFSFTDDPAAAASSETLPEAADSAAPVARALTACMRVFDVFSCEHRRLLIVCVCVCVSICLQEKQPHPSQLTLGN